MLKRHTRHSGFSFGTFIVMVLMLLLFMGAVHAERIKDIATVAGVRGNQLVGHGLVIGLDGTGDQVTQTPYTRQSLKNMLSRFGINLPPNVTLQPKNVAAVMVTAELPPFMKPGQNIDITVSSIGNAKSLRGGTLLITPLKGADGNIYALAQGNLVIGGFGAEGNDGSRIKVNVLNAGRIPNGAIVERAVPMQIGNEYAVTLDLHRPDFTTAYRLSDAINKVIGPGTAKAMDASSIMINAPRDVSQRISYVSMLENLEVDPGEAAARIIINSRTGTVVINKTVRVKPAAVSHGSLTVTITEDLIVSQPAPFSRRGTTAVVPQSDVKIEEEGDRMFKFSPGVNLDDIVRAVNEVGAAPGDLVAILEALKKAGALSAELIVI